MFIGSLKSSHYAKVNPSFLCLTENGGNDGLQPSEIDDVILDPLCAPVMPSGAKFGLRNPIDKPRPYTPALTHIS